MANALPKVCHKHIAPKDADNGIKNSSKDDRGTSRMGPGSAATKLKIKLAFFLHPAIPIPIAIPIRIRIRLRIA